MQLLDIDIISPGRYTAEFSGLVQIEERQARLSGISEAVKILTKEPGHYEIVGNPKSWYLAQAIQEAQVPVINVDHLNTRQLETLKKPITEKLSIIELAEKISDLSVDIPNLAELGRREGMPRSTVCNLIRIDSMPFDIKEQIRENPKQIKLGHAKVLAGLKNGQQQSLLNKIIQSGLSVRETEKRAKDDKPVIVADKDPNTLKLENRLTELLGCETTINEELGSLNIDYGKNLDILQGVLEHMGYEE